MNLTLNVKCTSELSILSKSEFVEDSTNTKKQKTKMEEKSKSNTHTPRRTLGMRRISPRVVQSKVKTTDTNDENSISASTHHNADNNYSETPKRIRLSTDYQQPKQKSNRKLEDIEAMDIEQMELLLNKYEKFQVQRSDLMQSINTWKTAGHKALEILQTEIQPEQEIETILTHFHLPDNVFD